MAQITNLRVRPSFAAVGIGLLVLLWFMSSFRRGGPQGSQGADVDEAGLPFSDEFCHRHARPYPTKPTDELRIFVGCPLAPPFPHCTPPRYVYSPGDTLACSNEPRRNLRVHAC